MTKQEWQRLERENFEKYKQEYIKFQFDRKNICKCSECPDNEGAESINTYPCGQRLCWVQCACKVGTE